jgi:HSP20 family protein
MTIRDLVSRNLEKRNLPQWSEGMNPFYSLQRELDRIFADFFEMGVHPKGDVIGEWSGTFIPKLDMKESDTTLDLSLELPGLDEKDVEVFITGDSLIIKGEKNQKREDFQNYHLVERSYGSFKRIISLPLNSEIGDVEAKFDKGVLNITVPKRKSKLETKKISIRSGN